MSLIEQAEALARVGKAGNKSAEPTQARMIHQVGELLTIARQVLDANLLTQEDIRAVGQTRSRLGDIDWPLGSVQGAVNPHIWANMLGGALEGMLKAINHRQNNGDWRLAEYELAVRRRSDVEYIVLVGRWIDVKKQPDLEYREGIPAVNVNVQSNLPKEVLDALAKGSGDPDTSKALAALAAAMEKQNQLLAHLVLGGKQKKGEKPESEKREGEGREGGDA